VHHQSIALSGICLTMAAMFGCAPDTEEPVHRQTWCVTDSAMDRQTRHRAVTGVMDLMKTTVIEDGSIVLLNRFTLTDADRNLFQIRPDGRVAKWEFSCSDPFDVRKVMTFSEGGIEYVVETFSTVERSDVAQRAQMVRVSVLGDDGAVGRFHVMNKVDGEPVDLLADLSARSARLGVPPENPAAFQAAKGAFIVPASAAAQDCELLGGVLECRFQIGPDQSVAFDLQIVPGTEEDLPRDQQDRVTFDRDAALAGEQAALKAFMDRLPNLSLPDQWHVFAFYSSAWLINIFRDSFDDLFLVKPGAFEYNSFWNRDAAFITRTMDLLGLHERAEESMRVFWRRPLPDVVNSQGTWGATIEQKSDGRWECPNHEWDGQGQVTWALVSHYRFTRDSGFLEDAYPAIALAMDWMIDNIEPRPSGHNLLPSGYGETLDTWNYVLLHNYWGVLGLDEAAWLAAEAGRPEDSALWGAQADQFRLWVRQAALDAYVGDSESGYIASAVGTESKRAWGSIRTVFPPRIMDPLSPEVGNTFEWLWKNRAQDQYRFEDDGNRIWTYMAAEWSQALLIRGEWERAWTLMNGFRAQASPVFGWWEEKYLNTGKGRGDSPHGWAAADYVSWLRSMLVREVHAPLPDADAALVDPSTGVTVELLGGVPPEWYVVGSPIVFERVPTTFGRLDAMSVQTGEDGARHVVADFELHQGSTGPSMDEFGVMIRMRGAVVTEAACAEGTVEFQADGVVVRGTDHIDCTIIVDQTAS